MIGKIMMGKSFKGYIKYCLEDKKQRQGQEVTFKNRAEVLFGNLCSGSKKELIEQFNEVRCLNRRVAKPVMHITLSLAPEDKLERGKLIQVVQDLSKEMNFEQHQYLAVSHFDTRHQHVHVVVNRIGLGGKTLKDSHSYRKIAAFCRKMEEKYGLRQVLSPRRFLPKEQRLTPRLNQRKETLRRDIAQSLSSCKTWEAFREKMKELGYQTITGRGICFIDAKGVRIKGSEVGYSYRTIESKLGQNNGLKLAQLNPKESQADTPVPPLIPKSSDGENIQKEMKALGKERQLERALETLMSSKDEIPVGVNPELLKEAKKKKKKRHSLHL